MKREEFMARLAKFPDATDIKLYAGAGQFYEPAAWFESENRKTNEIELAISVSGGAEDFSDYSEQPLKGTEKR